MSVWREGRTEEISCKASPVKDNGEKKGLQRGGKEGRERIKGVMEGSQIQCLNLHLTDVEDGKISKTGAQSKADNERHMESWRKKGLQERKKNQKMKRRCRRMKKKAATEESPVSKLSNETREGKKDGNKQ